MEFKTVPAGGGPSPSLSASSESFSVVESLSSIASYLIDFQSSIWSSASVAEWCRPFAHLYEFFATTVYATWIPKIHFATSATNPLHPWAIFIISAILYFLVLICSTRAFASLVRIYRAARGKNDISIASTLKNNQTDNSLSSSASSSSSSSSSSGTDDDENSDHDNK